MSSGSYGTEKSSSSASESSGSGGSTGSIGGSASSGSSGSSSGGANPPCCILVMFHEPNDITNLWTEYVALSSGEYPLSENENWTLVYGTDAHPGMWVWINSTTHEEIGWTGEFADHTDPDDPTGWYVGPDASTMQVSLTDCVGSSAGSVGSVGSTGSVGSDGSVGSEGSAGSGGSSGPWTRYEIIINAEGGWQCNDAEGTVDRVWVPNGKHCIVQGELLDSGWTHGSDWHNSDFTQWQADYYGPNGHQYGDGPWHVAPDGYNYPMVGENVGRMLARLGPSGAAYSVGTDQINLYNDQGNTKAIFAAINRSPDYAYSPAGSNTLIVWVEP